MFPPEHPSFVIRNAIHATTNDLPFADCATSGDKVGTTIEDTASTQCHNINFDLSSFLPIVQLVVDDDGEYMLDFDRETIDSFATNIFSKEDNSNDVYIDRNSWVHLIDYSDLVGKPIVKDRNETEIKILPNTGNYSLETNVGSYVLLMNDAKAVVQSLLDIRHLFTWKALLDSMQQGKLQRKHIREYLSIVRKCVPFANNDGMMREKNANTITFHQFVVFARMIERHIESFVPIVETIKSDLRSEVFPPFDSFTPIEKEIELLASIRDKEVQKRARASGLIVPTSSLDIEEQNDEWHRYIQWWNTNRKARYGCCMRELQFAAEDADVRRIAKESDIAEHDPFCKLKALPGSGFVNWYYGKRRNQVPCADSENSTFVEDPQTSLLADSEAYPNEHLPTARKVLDGASIILSAHRNPSPIQRDQVTSSVVVNDKSGTLENYSIVGSRVQFDTKPVSMRFQLLKRATLQFDTLKLLISRKNGSKLRGAKLFQSKVRLVIMIRKFLGISPFQLPVVTPDNLDLFSLHHYPDPMEININKKCARVEYLQIQNAKAHRIQILRKKLMKNWLNCTRELKVTSKRIDHTIQEMTASRQKTLMTKCFRALRAYSSHRNLDRADAVKNDVSSHWVDDETPFLVNELSGMKRTARAGRECFFELNELPKDVQQLVANFQGSRAPSAQHLSVPRSSPFQLFDKSTLQRMKREKLAGASNLYDVPKEIITYN